MFIQKLVHVLLVILCFSLLGMSAIAAQDTLLINYQGHLTDNAGDPVTDTPSMTFTIYDGAGVSKWTESYLAVQVINGLFNVILGSQTALPDSVFYGDDRYLGIAVGAEPEIDPRTLLTSAPGAAVSKRVVGDIRTGPQRLLVESTTGDSAVVLVAEGDFHAIRLHPPEPCVPPDPCQPAMEMVTEPDKNIIRLYPPDPCVPPEPCGPAFEVSAVTGVHSITLNKLGDSIPAFTVLTGNVTGDFGLLELDPAPPEATTFLSFRVESNVEAGEVALTVGSPPDSGKPGVEIASTSSVATLIVQGEDLLGEPPRVAIVAGAEGAKLGIGTGIPEEALDVNGTTQTTAFKMPTGATDGHVLTSDAEGNGTWQAPGFGGSDAGEFDGEVSADMVEDALGVTTIDFNSPFTSTDRPHMHISVVLKQPSSGLVEGSAIKAVVDIKGAPGNWTGFDITVSKHSGGSVADTSPVYVSWLAIGR